MSEENKPKAEETTSKPEPEATPPNEAKSEPSPQEPPKREVPKSEPSSPHYYDVKPEAQGHSRALVYLLALIVFALIAIVLYLLSERNSQKLYLVESEGHIHLKQGYYFPVGSRDFTPANDIEQKAYAPIPLPPEAKPFKKTDFLNRIDMNNHLAELLVKWSEARLKSQNDEEFKLGWSYLRRAELLPGLPQAAMDKMRTLKGSYIYFDGVRLVSGLEDRIKRALDRFIEAKTQKTMGHDKEVDEWIAKSRSILEILQTRQYRKSEAELLLEGREKGGAALEKDIEASPKNAPPSNPPKKADKPLEPTPSEKERGEILEL